MKKIRARADLKFLIILASAFFIVYTIWGSTYLGIKYAIETLPSFLMAGVRFTVAGGVLFLIARLLPGYETPKREHWRTSFIVGTLLLTVGNGCIVVAEHYISSSLAALLVATLPFWMVLLGWLFAGAERPSPRIALGLLVGFIGVGLLISGSSSGVSSSSADYAGHIFGIVLVIVSTIGWTIGSLYGAKAPTVNSPLLTAAMQMLAGGIMLLVVSTIGGEWRTFDIAAVSANSAYALLYLIIFGSIVAYTAYAWLIKNASPAAISTYAYVNPVVAVLLGWGIAGEQLSPVMIVGALIIVASVALVTMRSNKLKAHDDDGSSSPRITRPDGRPAELSASS